MVNATIHGQLEKATPGTGTPKVKDWEHELSSDRPVYDCPHCKQVAMQFYAQIPGEPGREESFRCHACGSTWQV